MHSIVIYDPQDTDSDFFPEVTYSRSGVVFNPREDLWKFRDAVNDVRLKFYDLPISDSLRISLKKVLLWYMQNQASSSAMSYLSEFQKFSRFARGSEDSILDVIDENSLISYRASLSINKRWQFGRLSTLLRKWVSLSISGITKVAAKLLFDLKNPGMQKGRSILNSDPIHGPLNDIEFQQISSAIKKSYKSNDLQLCDYVLLLLVMCLGQRPVQYASLKVCDVYRIENENGLISYMIRMPRAKQKLQLARSQFTKKLLDSELGAYVWAHAQEVKKNYSMLISNVEECPLFPVTGHEKHNYLPGFEFHQTSQELGAHVTKIANSLRVISPRTGTFINLTTYRFRRTTGTRAAQEGYGELAIAALLDHTDTQNVGVYIEALPDIVKRIDKAIALHIAPLAQAFAGKLVDREKDADRGDDPASRITSPAIDSEPMGSCGNYGFCNALAPLACYTCRDFQPWREGPHEAVLDYLLAERERLGKSADTNNSFGLLRRWNFARADTRFQTEDGRAEIAGRERKVIAWLDDRNPKCGEILFKWSKHEPFLNWVKSLPDGSQAIGVICAYAAQLDLVRRKLQSESLPEVFRRTIKVDTIDSYQGKENLIVMLSLVRNNADGAKSRGISTINPGFMAKKNRINVALSRAMDRLLVVGAKSGWREGSPLGLVSTGFDEEIKAGDALQLDAIELVSSLKTDRKKKNKPKDFQEQGERVE